MFCLQIFVLESKYDVPTGLGGWRELGWLFTVNCCGQERLSSDLNIISIPVQNVNSLTKVVLLFGLLRLFLYLARELSNILASGRNTDGIKTIYTLLKSINCTIRLQQHQHYPVPQVNGARK
jgi:hypothetical protein